MRKFVSVGLVGSIAFTVSSCSSHADKNVEIKLPLEPSTTAKTPATEQPFSTKTTPLVSQMSAPENIPGLVQATNGDERAKQIQRIIDREKRQDPFAAVPVTLQQSGSSPDRTVNPLNRSPFPAPTPRQTQVRRRTLAPKVAYYPYSPPVKPVSVKSKPNIALRPRQPVTAQAGQKFPLISALPPLPSANLAKAIEVSGIVVVGDVAQAIVKASNEASSRHIKVGQRLYNGQVLVKRIEVTAGTEPMVIFEENGVEVAKAIG